MPRLAMSYNVGQREQLGQVIGAHRGDDVRARRSERRQMREQSEQRIARLGVRLREQFLELIDDDHVDLLRRGVRLQEVAEVGERCASNCGRPSCRHMRIGQRGQRIA